jgi:hypothetical protein
MVDAVPVGPTTAAAAAGSPPQASANARSVVIRIALLVGILGFVFVILLPQVVDYDDVRAALAALTPGQLLALVSPTSSTPPRAGSWSPGCRGHMLSRPTSRRAPSRAPSQARPTSQPG